MNNISKTKLLLFVAFLATIAATSYQMGYGRRAAVLSNQENTAATINSSLSLKGEQSETPYSVPNSARESSSTESANAAQNKNNFVPVVRVIDGDTIVVNIGGQDVRVRLIGIDSPELRDKRLQVACLAEKSRKEAEKLLGGQNIVLEKDPTQGDYDKYNRLLAYVFLPTDSTSLPRQNSGQVTANGTNFNKLMIKNGYAYEYTYNLPYKYQEEFKAAQTEARAAQKGLWSPDACSK